VSPLRGGEADKFGNRYEGRWTTRELLYVLQGQVDSVTIEEVGEIGKEVEFTLGGRAKQRSIRSSGSTEAPISGSCSTSRPTGCWQLPRSRWPRVGSSGSCLPFPLWYSISWRMRLGGRAIFSRLLATG
jgi:hypothetical protein